MSIVQEFLDIRIAFDEGVQFQQDAALGHQRYGFNGVPDDIDALAAEHGGDDLLGIVAPAIQRNGNIVDCYFGMLRQETFKIGFPFFLGGERTRRRSPRSLRPGRL